MSKSSHPSAKTAHRQSPFRRRAAVAGVLILILSFIVYISPVTEIPARAGDAVLPPAVTEAASLEPAQTPCSTSTSRAVIGEFGPVIRLPLVPVHLSVLPNKKVIFWARDKTGTTTDPKEAVAQSNAYVWDPASIRRNADGTPFIYPDGTQEGITTLVRNSTTNLFCSGHSFLPDGRLLVTGGHRSPDFDGAGERHTNIFNYANNTWSRGPDMNLGRWYPYNVTLATGESLIMAGSYWSNEPNSTTPTISPNLTPQLYTLEGRLKNMAAATSLTFYPYLHLGPDGKVFQAMSGRLMGGTRPFSRISRQFNPNANRGAGSWRDLGSTVSNHESGSSVLYDVNGKIVLAGGFSTTGNLPTNAAEVIDLTVNDPTTGAPKWRSISPMNQPRVYNTATLLPNGKVLVTGGTQCAGGNNVDCTGDPFTGAVMDAEMWDPTGNPAPDPASVPWCKVAKQKQIRVYHSTAVLLPDATVLVAGGGLPGAVGELDDNGNLITDLRHANAKTSGHRNAEIYRPPYLFDSFGNPITSRPTITSAPLPTTTISYGQTFTVGVSGAGAAPKVSLVRLPSVTHAFNQDQRILFPSSTLSGSTLSVVAPGDANKCPPGHYMLFVMNGNVPSVAAIVKIGQDDGYLDGVNGAQIWGWAWDRNFGSNPINVDIYEGDTFVARVPADQFRQDLLNAGKGNGWHGFSYTIPPEMWKDGQVHQINVRFANSTTNLPTNNLGSSPRSIAVASMFPVVQPGSVTTVGAGGQTWEQAIQFSANVSGKITHLRYYKVAGETGTHVGRIWSDTGVPLAQVTFQNETASGWQTQALPTPLQITGGVRYRVSYNVNTFGGKILNAFGPAITNAQLTAWAAMYTTPAGTFPNTGSVSNFLADVIFEVPR